MNIAITEPEYKKAEAVFVSNKEMNCIPAPPDEYALAKFIKSQNARHVIIGTMAYTDALYEALPNGSVIARFGAAYDGVDLQKIIKFGLYLTNTPGIVSNAVAELTIAYLLMASRAIIQMSNAMKQGVWSPIIGRELRGRTLAVIGCGAIGKRVSQIAALGYQMKVIGYDIGSLNVEEMKSQFGFHSIVGSFPEAVRNADFVSIHIPLIKSTFHYLDAQKLSIFPQKSWLINTSRGAIVDQKALFQKLKSGELKGAAMDVFDKEPYEPCDEAFDFRTLDNVILTPHAGTTTQEATLQIAERCIQNIRFAEDGEFDKMDIIVGPGG